VRALKFHCVSTVWANAVDGGNAIIASAARERSNGLIVSTFGKNG
jgi:hypothetical protein